MTRLLVSIAVACGLLIPAVVLAGNAAPKLYLELWQYETVPDPLPEEVCVHTVPVPPTGIHCYDVKSAYYFAVVGLHIGNLDQPVCPTPSVSCETAPAHGGFLGVPFGIFVTGEAIAFVSWNPCPGFVKGPSAVGEPAACLATSPSTCNDWQDHVGYLIYLNMSDRTGMTTLSVVINADLALYKVINCHNEYDNGTTVAGGAQWGGAQSITCSTTPVANTSWGRIKSLFR